MSARWFLGCVFIANHVRVTKCKGLPFAQVTLHNIHWGRELGSISRPTDYEKSVLTSCPERCAVSRKSATGICRNRTVLFHSVIYNSVTGNHVNDAPLLRNIFFEQEVFFLSFCLFKNFLKIRASLRILFMSFLSFINSHNSDDCPMLRSHKACKEFLI